MSARRCHRCPEAAVYYWHDAGPFGAGTFYGCADHAPRDVHLGVVARAEQTGHCEPGHTFGPGQQARPFRRSGRRNSWHGGWRHIAIYVERLDGWWWRKRWAEKMDYSDDRGSTRGQVCTRHRTIEEANAAAAATWAAIEADHERIEAHVANREQVGQ